MVTFVSKRRSVQELKILLRCERLASLQFSGLSNALLRTENDGKYTMIQSHGVLVGFLKEAKPVLSNSISF